MTMPQPPDRPWNAPPPPPPPPQALSAVPVQDQRDSGALWLGEQTEAFNEPRAQLIYPDVVNTAQSRTARNAAPWPLQSQRQQLLFERIRLIVLSVIGSLIFFICVAVIGLHNDQLRNLLLHDTSHAVQSSQQPLTQRTATTGNALTTPTITPTARLQPTAAPVLQATLTPTPAPLPLTISCLNFQNNRQATICVQSLAGVTLSLLTTDCDGVIDSNAPTAGTTDNAGKYTASWQPRQPNNGCHTAVVSVSATRNDQQGKVSGTLTLSSGD